MIPVALGLGAWLAKSAALAVAVPRVVKAARQFFIPTSVPPRNDGAHGGFSPPGDAHVVYRYDLNHNRTRKDETTYKSNANDQLTSTRRPNQTLAYNAAGQARQAGVKNLTFAYNDQIKTVSSNSHSAAYLYDGNGQRVQKSVDGVASKFLWAGDEILKEYTASGQMQAQYLLGAERTAIKHNGQWNFYLSDGLGSTVMLTGPNGHPLATWDYSDDGETTQLSGSPSVYNPFLYTGQELDPETGFYHLRARHYAPSLGKFLARDPIGYAGGLNLYAYCNGDSINCVDPSGLAPVTSIIINSNVISTINQDALVAGIRQATGASVTFNRMSSVGSPGVKNGTLTVNLREKANGYGLGGTVYFGHTDPGSYTSNIYINTIRDKVAKSESRKEAIRQLVAGGMARECAERFTEENFRTNVALHELSHILGLNGGHTSGNADLMSNGFYNTPAAWLSVSSIPQGWVSPAYFPGAP